MLRAALILLVTATAASAGQHQHVAVPETPPLFPQRESSGTAWLPDETPMFGLMRQAGPWQVMVHGSLFGQFLYESGNRHRTGGFSSNQISSVNWAVVMGRRAVGVGRIGFRVMGSAEPWTVGDCGFINLLANGEMCEGDTIHDRQHPHDAIMELAVEYDRPLRGSLRLQTYAGPGGRAGPGTGRHRSLGSDKKLASTIAYGVNANREVIPGGSVYLVTHAALAEASLMIRDSHIWFGRMEVAGKAGHDLHVHESSDSVFAVGKLEVGYTRHFRPWRGLVPGVGGVASGNVVPTPLAPRYSGHVALGVGMFFVIRPNRHADAGKVQ